MSTVLNHNKLFMVQMAVNIYIITMEECCMNIKFQAYFF